MLYVPFALDKEIKNIFSYYKKLTAKDDVYLQV